MNVQQAIAQFLEHGQSVRNLSDRTLRAYQSDLAQFHIHMSDTLAIEVTPEHLEGYLEKLDGGPYRDTSVRRKVAAIKVFFRFLEEQGIVSESPARRLKIKKPVENRVPTVLSTREVRALLAAPESAARRAPLTAAEPGSFDAPMMLSRSRSLLRCLVSPLE